jgi:O-succinylbenzoic acid--CoA ligase
LTLSVFDAANEAGSRTAITHERGLLTYTALAARVQRTLDDFAQRGVTDPSGVRPVALVAAPSLPTVERLFALFAAGTPALLLHPRATDAERAALCQEAGAVDADSHRGPPSPPAQAPFDPERIAALVATSGSSGKPKLARLSHRALVAAAHSSAQHLGVEPGDRWLACLPLSHVGGLSVLTRMLVARRTSVLFDAKGPLLASLPELVSCLDEQRVTLLSVVPAILDRLLSPPLHFHAPRSLRAVLTGGASLSATLLGRAAACGVPVLPTYGLTEASAQVATRPYALRGRAARPEAHLAPSGVALPGVELRILHNQIEVRGPTLFSGYAGDAAFHPPDRWFRTEDRAYFDEAGELVVTGRSDDCIVTGGEKVDPAEVEAALMTLPGVSGACVFGAPDEVFGETIIAVLEGQLSHLGPREIASELGERLSRYKLPRRVLWVNELPLLSSSNKVDRRLAKAFFFDASHHPRG